jgi:hypothetical protein
MALNGAFTDDNRAELSGIQRLASDEPKKETKSAAAIAVNELAVIL